jgi:hypothetical protein
MKRRRGVVLVELVMLVALGSVLMGLSAGLLHALLKVDRSGRAHLAGLARETRLAQLFRADVRAARRPVGATPAESLALDLGDGHTVEYRLQNKELLRFDRVKDTIRNQDAFPLPPGGSTRFEVEPRGPITLVRLVIARAPATTGLTVRRETRIEAVLGQEHRFEIVEK